MSCSGHGRLRCCSPLTRCSPTASAGPSGMQLGLCCRYCLLSAAQKLLQPDADACHVALTLMMQVYSSKTFHQPVCCCCTQSMAHFVGEAQAGAWAPVKHAPLTLSALRPADPAVWRDGCGDQAQGAARTHCAGACAQALGPRCQRGAPLLPSLPASQLAHASVSHSCNSLSCQTVGAGHGWDPLANEVPPVLFQQLCGSVATIPYAIRLEGMPLPAYLRSNRRCHVCTQSCSALEALRLCS